MDHSGDNNPNFKEGRKVTVSFRTTEERRVAVKELAAAMSTTDDKKTVSDVLNQLIDDAYDAHNQQTEAFLPASPPARHRPTPPPTSSPVPTTSAEGKPTPPPPANISFDEAIEILKRNGGVRKLPRRQLWHFGKHKIRLDEDGIIEEAEKYLKRESPPAPTTSSPRPPLPIDKAWKLVRMNEGGTKTRGKQEYTIHGQVFGADDIIKWAEKYR